ncbi:MAG TPA: DUF6600 domain-containing protein [Methylibium sp.]|nr:DUF6600 domain-containing protein [Methylibium sp.]
MHDRQTPPAPPPTDRPRRCGRVRGLLLALVPALLLALPVRAEIDMDAAQDPPARVGRVSVLRGQVDASTEPGAAWQPARVNQPVTTQTAFWVPPGSQAELRIGSAAVRMDGNTQAVFSQLDDHGIAIDVAQGTVRARVRNLPAGDAFSLSADGVRADALMPGDYRVAYDPDLRRYTVRALSGRLRVVTPTNSVNLEAGQESLVERGGGALQLRAIGPRDDFDLWAEARDREHDRLIASRYVSPETTGIEELDEHGRWEVDDGYGAVWYPAAVPYGWAPYRYGRWAWVAPWGWTWVDDSAWGFAPFHYGRWALVGHRWGWVPGPIVARPVWAPALVGWVGGHSGNISWSIGIGAPIGWFPLAPYEFYYPTYRHSVIYIDRVNIVRDRVPYDPQRSGLQRPRERDPQRAGGDPQRDPQRYRYAQHRDALTVVREDAFRNARPVARERIALDPQQVASLRPIVRQSPEVGGVAPGRGVRVAPGQPRAPVEALPPPPVPRAADPQAAGRPVPERGRGRGDDFLRRPAPAQQRSEVEPATPQPPRDAQRRGPDAVAPPERPPRGRPPAANPRQDQGQELRPSSRQERQEPRGRRDRQELAERDAMRTPWVAEPRGVAPAPAQPRPQWAPPPQAQPEQARPQRQERQDQQERRHDRQGGGPWGDR